MAAVLQCESHSMPRRKDRARITEAARKLGGRIEAARKAAGYLNAAEFARKAGVTRQYLANLENGLSEHPYPGPLKRIADAAHVPVDYIITGRNPPREVLAQSADAGDVLDAFTHLTREQKRELLDTLIQMDDLQQRMDKLRHKK